jgi:NagD protein
MKWAALNRLRAHSEATVMIGDRMDSDIVAGIEADMRTVLVLTRIMTAEEVARNPYRPGRVVDSVPDLVDDI